MKIEIIPAILEKHYFQVEEQIKRLSKVGDWLSLDVEDGSFTNVTTFNDPPALRRLYTKAKLEIDLMILEPEKSLDAWLAVKAVKRITLHLETLTNARALIKKINRHKLQAGLAINPETSIARLKPFLKEIKVAQIMGIKPGKQGQKFQPRVLSKVKALRQLAPGLNIAVDGGVNLKTVAPIVRAGANYLIIGSYFKKSRDPLTTQKNLKKLINQTTYAR